MRPSAIDVRITMPLAAPPAIARQAWLDYTWKRGGGLPIVVRTQDEGSGRTVYPLLLKEVLSSDAAVESGQDVAEAIEYKVVSNGLLAGELVPDSHRATVAFLSQPDRTTMLDWRVTFSAKHRPWLWKAVTQQTVGGAAAGLAAYLRPQTARYRLTARLDGCTSASDALDAWSTLTWEGGGLPLPPPLVLSRDKLGPGTIEILRLPHPLLRERVDLVDRERNVAEYRVVNPGPLTLPVHMHRGRVSFAEGGAAGAAPSSSQRDNENDDRVAEPAATTMTWEVTLRAYDGTEAAVKAFIGLAIRTIARNIQARFSTAAQTLHDEWEEIPGVWEDV